MIGFPGLLIVVLAILIWGVLRNDDFYSRTNDFLTWRGTCLTLFIILVFIFSLTTISNICSLANYKQDIVMVNQKMANNEQRIKEVLPVVVAKLDSYTEYEKGIFTKFVQNSSTLIQFPPELKADSLTLTAAEEIKACVGYRIECKDAISEVQREINKKKATMFWYCIWAVR